MKYLFPLFAWGWMIIYSAFTNASISLSATRVIYEGTQRDVSINVVNNSNNETLIQSWLEQEENNQNSMLFAVTPPLAKIKGNQKQLLRILYLGSGLPQDKESVFWLNVQDIPQQAEGENKLQLALRQRVKLFYRPAGLTGTASQAPTKLTVKAMKNRLELYNPTPYHINMISFRQGGLKIKGRMILPGESLTLEATGIRTLGEFYITVINDFGGLSTYTSKFINGLSTGLDGHK